MMRVDEHITFREQRDIFWAEPRVSGKHPNHAKFASEFTRDFWREITVQLNAANSSNVCGFPNVLGIPVNENANCMNVCRQRIDNLPSHFWLDAARALRIKVQPDHLCAELNGCVRVSCVCNAADFDLHWSHDGRAADEVTYRASTLAIKSRSAFSGSVARISVSPIRKPRKPSTSRRRNDSAYSARLCWIERREDQQSNRRNVFRQ